MSTAVSFDSRPFAPGMTVIPEELIPRESGNPPRQGFLPSSYERSTGLRMIHDASLVASWPRVPAAILLGALFSLAFGAVRIATGGLAEDANQDGYGDDRDDQQNE